MSASADALSWGAAWRIARRDLNGRFRGLRLLLVCLFLGVGALSAIGTLTAAIQGELQSQGQVILGGDLEVEVWQRPLNEDERAFLGEYGTLSPGYRMQAMASTEDAASPVELKAVANNWPMYGALTLASGETAGAPPEGTAWIAQGAAERLELAVGDTFTVGRQALTVGGIIADEPKNLRGTGAVASPAFDPHEFVTAGAVRNLVGHGAYHRLHRDYRCFDAVRQ